jgi:adenosine deaminase
MIDTAYLRQLPKAELHLHIEGTLEPELIFELARRNRVDLPYPDVEALRRAYAFTDLQSFLDLYYAATAVLQTEEDFHDMTRAYLEHAKADNIRHVEIFFDPQSHTSRGVPIGVVFAGIARALRESGPDLSARMILCFLRHLPESDATQTLEAALPLRSAYDDLWVGVGLDSSERGHPPEKFERVFAMARNAGLTCVAHAGEEGPPAYIENALDRLKVSRIDHGVRCEEDSHLLARLVRDQTPLTICPLSNVRLGVFSRLEEHNLARLLRAGVRVTINSDDPAYFGGYLLENYVQTALALGLEASEMTQIARNGFTSSLLGEADTARWVTEIDQIEAASVRTV